MQLNVSYFSVDNHLEMLLGRRYREPAYSWSISIVYCIIFIAGLTGNVCTMLVIAKTKKMYTATNCYLFSLSISDTLTLLLGMPPEFYLVWVQYPWPFGSAYCVFKSFISELTSYASVLTILLFTVERWLAICYPMKNQLISSVSRSIKILVCIWISALLCASPYAYLSRAFYAVEYPLPCTLPNLTSFVSSNHSTWTMVGALHKAVVYRGEVGLSCAVYAPVATGSGANTPTPSGFIEESLTCSITPEFAELGNVLLQCSIGIFFVAPMIIITVLYARIAMALSGTDSIFARVSIKARNRNPNGTKPPIADDKSDKTRAGERQTQAARREKEAASGSGGSGHTRKAALRILIAVVIVFFFSYAPYHLQRVISVHHNGIPFAILILDYLYQFSAVFYYVSSSVNPILYNVASKRFRRAFMQALCNCSGSNDSSKAAAALSIAQTQPQPQTHYNTTLASLQTPTSSDNASKSPISRSQRGRIASPTTWSTTVSKASDTSRLNSECESSTFDASRFPSSCIAADEQKQLLSSNV